MEINQSRRRESFHLWSTIGDFAMVMGGGLPINCESNNYDDWLNTFNGHINNGKHSYIPATNNDIVWTAWKNANHINVATHDVDRES